MLIHLLDTILLNTKPINYLEIKKSNRLVSSINNQNYKLSFITFIKDKYYSNATFYKKLLNGHNYGKELILFSYNYPNEGNTTFIIKHKLISNFVKVEQLYINYEYDCLEHRCKLFFQLVNYIIDNYSIIRNFIIFNHYDQDTLDYYYRHEEEWDYKFTEEEKKIGINIDNWDKSIDTYLGVKYNNIIFLKDDYKSKDNFSSVVKDLTRKDRKLYPIFLDVKNKKFEINN